MVRYQDVEVDDAEQATLLAIEKQIGKAILNVNEIENGTFGFIASGGHVTQLGLCQKGLTSLPETIGNLRSLKTLDLRLNQLACLPKTIGMLQSLEKLYLVETGLFSLPETIGGLKLLQVLDLRSNQLSNLPRSIGALKSLSQLWLGGNRLFKLPESIGDLQSLKNLHLFNNELTSLPDTIANLLALQILDLSFNKILSLPQAIGKLKALTLIDLSSNPLSSLPESIGELQSLQELYLNDSKISSLPETIGNLKSLKTLDLERNKVSILPKSMENLQNLSELYFGSNQISSFQEIKKIINAQDASTGEIRMFPHEEYLKITCCLTGSTCVGKTALLARYITHEFVEALNATMGIDIRDLKLDLNLGYINHRVAISLKEISGRYIFEKLHGFWFKGADAAIIVVGQDIPDSVSGGKGPSFKIFGVNDWVESINNANKSKFVPKILVINRSDLQNEIVDDNEIKEICRRNKILGCYRTSAKTGENVNRIFHIAAEMGIFWGKDHGMKAPTNQAREMPPAHEGPEASETPSFEIVTPAYPKEVPAPATPSHGKPAIKPPEKPAGSPGVMKSAKAEEEHKAGAQEKHEKERHGGRGNARGKTKASKKPKDMKKKGMAGTQEEYQSQDNLQNQEEIRKSEELQILQEWPEAPAVRCANGALVFKIMIWGPENGGKEEFFSWIYKKEKYETTQTQSFSDSAGRFLFFGKRWGKVSNVRFQVITVVGHRRNKFQSRIMKKGAGAIIFIWDSDPIKWNENIYSLKELLQIYGAKMLSPDGDKTTPEMPFIMCANKRDLPDAIPIEKIKEALKAARMQNTVIFETVTTTGLNLERAFVYAARESVLRHYQKLKTGEPVPTMSEPFTGTNDKQSNYGDIKSTLSRAKSITKQMANPSHQGKALSKSGIGPRTVSKSASMMKKSPETTDTKGYHGKQAKQKTMALKDESKTNNSTQVGANSETMAKSGKGIEFSYQEVPLPLSEIAILKELQQIIGKPIPNLPKVEPKSFGFAVINGHVTALGLSKSRLSSIPKNIHKLTSLETVYLERNRLPSIPESIGNLKSLKKLYLSSNKLSSLPSSVGNLQALKELRLSNNKITILPGTIGDLKSLEYLDLNSNKLSTLPETIGNLKMLNKLILNKNPLSTLPGTIGKLTSLKSIYLHDCMLTSIPETIGQLSALEMLYLDGNKLSSLPEALIQLKSLIFLDISRNQLSSVPVEIRNWLNAFEKNDYKNLRMKSQVPIHTFRSITTSQNNISNDSPNIETSPTSRTSNIDTVKQDGMLKQKKKVIWKIIIMGDSGIGKTTLLHRYVNNKFIADTKSTFALKIDLKNITFNNVECTLQLWDLAGGQQYRSMLKTYSAGANGAILMYDLTRVQSTLSLEDSWLPLLREVNPDMPIILVGTKLDLVDPNIHSSTHDFGVALSRSYDLQGYLKTSSKTGEKVDEAFQMLVKCIFDHNNISQDSNKAQSSGAMAPPKKNDQIHSMQSNNAIKHEPKIEIENKIAVYRQNKEFVLKILVAGEGGVGKTTLLHRYVSNRFIADTSMTIGIQFHVKHIIFSGVKCALQFWDFSGQERFRFLLPGFASGAKGALLLFDLTRMQTSFSLENSWLPLIRKEDSNMPVILMGTKLDMVDPNFPAIEPNFGKEFISSHNLQGYIETSSKTSEKVEETFRMLVKCIFDYNNISYDPNVD